MTMQIHPTAIVAEGATLGDGVTIGAYSLIGPHVVLKENVKIQSHVVVDGYTIIGAGTEIFPFATIGLSPQHLHYKGEHSSLEIGEKCVIREYVTVHPGTEVGGMKTTIGNGCLIMVGAHIAHDCHVGNSVVMANNATRGGHVTVGDHAIIGGLAAIHQFVRIGAHSIISGTAGVTSDVIPFGAVIVQKGRLGGINIIGMKRRGFERQDIHALRNVYNLLAKGQEGTLEVRLQKIKTLYGQSKPVQDLIAFIEGDHKQSLCLPGEVWDFDDTEEIDDQRAAAASR